MVRHLSLHSLVRKRQRLEAKIWPPFYPPQSVNLESFQGDRKPRFFAPGGHSPGPDPLSHAPGPGDPKPSNMDIVPNSMSWTPEKTTVQISLPTKYPALEKSNDIDGGGWFGASDSDVTMLHPVMVPADFDPDELDKPLDIVFPGLGDYIDDCGEKTQLKCRCCGSIFEGRAWCRMRECPTCETRWANHESMVGSDRLWLFRHSVENGYYYSEGPDGKKVLRGTRGRLIHYVVSFRMDHTQLTLRKFLVLRDLVIIVAKIHGLIGGVNILHHIRRGKGHVHDEGIHFHGIGFAPGHIRPGHDLINSEKDPDEKIDIDGEFINFMVIPDPNYKKYRGFQRLRNVKQCFNYILSHCAIIKGRHAPTWYGLLSNRSFRQSDLNEFFLNYTQKQGYGYAPCPVCGVRWISEPVAVGPAYSGGKIEMRKRKPLVKIYTPVALALDVTMGSWYPEDTPEFERSYVYDDRSNPEVQQQLDDLDRNREIEYIDMTTGESSFPHSGDMVDSPYLGHVPYPVVDKACDNCRRFPCQGSGLMDYGPFECRYPNDFIWKHDRWANMSDRSEDYGSVDYKMYFYNNYFIPEPIKRRLPPGWRVIRLGILPNGGRLNHWKNKD